MGQTRADSLLEASGNTIISLLVYSLTTMASLFFTTEPLTIIGINFLVSIIKNYLVRRMYCVREVR